MTVPFVPLSNHLPHLKEKRSKTAQYPMAFDVKEMPGKCRVVHNLLTALHGHFTVLHGHFTVLHGLFTVLHGLLQSSMVFFLQFYTVFLRSHTVYLQSYTVFKQTGILNVQKRKGFKRKQLDHRSNSGVPGPYPNE